MGSVKETKHLWFVYDHKSPSGLTQIWEVRNRKQNISLGWIKWAGNFRKYAYFPNPESLYDATCLRDIADFCEELTKDK